MRGELLDLKIRTGRLTRSAPAARVLEQGGINSFLTIRDAHLDVSVFWNELD